jgi:mannose-6-phosphate isomerase-like protein (cupin superfamily)
MVRKIEKATKINRPDEKFLEEYVGRVNTGTSTLSLAHMIAKPGWTEPFQTPEFTEVTLVLRGRLRVEFEGGVTDVGPGEAVLCEPGERVRYSNPFPEENEYWSVCVPAFHPDTVHRDEELRAKP